MKHELTAEDLAIANALADALHEQACAGERLDVDAAAVTVLRERSRRRRAERDAARKVPQT